MKKYQVIYTDPAWKYDFAETDSRKIENQYPTMELEEIKNLPINEIADTNCVLYLWATAPKLIEALEVIKAWGFEYKTHAIWDKGVIGMGYWFRGQHELLIVATKGTVSPPMQNIRKSSVLKYNRNAHSKKPDAVRQLISLWFPKENKVELFARQRFQGWDVWGNEAPNFTQLSLPSADGDIIADKPKSAKIDITENIVAD